MSETKKLNPQEVNPYLRFIEKLGPYTEKNYFVPKRIIYDYEMIFIMEGELVAEIANQEIHLQQYDLHIIPPFIEHRHYIPQNKFCQYYCLHFDFYYDEDTADFSAVTEYSRYCSPEVSVMPINEDLKNRDVGTIGSLEFPYKVHIDEGRKMSEQFDRLYICEHSAGLGNEFRTKGELLCLLADIVDVISKTESDCQTNLNTSVVINNFINSITAHYDRPIDICRFAIENGYSPDYFRRIFKKVTNKTPVEYLTEYRLKQAKKLLSSRLYTVQEVCYMVGYENVSYFSKLFKQKEGASPSAYIKGLVK